MDRETAGELAESIGVASLPSLILGPRNKHRSILRSSKIGTI